jgi:hypothetical protein
MITRRKEYLLTKARTRARSVVVSHTELFSEKREQRTSHLFISSEIIQQTFPFTNKNVLTGAEENIWTEER